MLSQSSMDPFTGTIDSLEMLHDVMKYIPFNRRTLTAMRCVSKPFRRGVQSTQSPWSGYNEMMLSCYGQCVLFNAQEDDKGNSCFELISISPIGRKFQNVSARVLSRYHTRVANGLTKLVLHYSHIDDSSFETLATLTNLRELEFVSCRSLTSIGNASLIKKLEKLEVAFCPLEHDGVQDLSLPLLKTLIFRSCHRLSDLNEIASETAASLEEVTIENCNAYDDTSNIFLHNLGPHLRVLSLCSTHIDGALALITQHDHALNLQTLQLSDTPIRTETLDQIVSFLKDNLEYLSLENCKKLNGFEPLGMLHRLRFLDVSQAELTDGLDMLAGCKYLELLRVANSTVEDISFLGSMPFLRVLDAPASSLTDSGILALRDAPELDTVVLTRCIHISDLNVLQTCPRIRRIFCAQTSITEKSIADLAECDNLEELDIKLTAVKDVNFMAACKSLKSINVCSTVDSIEGIQDLLDRQDLDVVCDSFDGGQYMD
ncbi:unnamed protein product [Phytomonas sp. Hart1]|nr:unnamed protein product [Phytomonas sp. Hart1]|eukprot:CCW68318.1 unnamed protein product [Phytomonas sp. isolate Hart1]